MLYQFSMVAKMYLISATFGDHERMDGNEMHIRTVVFF